MPRDVHFTQYLLPDGRKTPVMIERPDDIATLADRIRLLGHRFECEMLGDMQTVSLTVTALDPDEPDIGIEICKNGPGVEEAVDRLILNAAKKLKIPGAPT